MSHLPKTTPVPSQVIMDPGIQPTLLQTYERILALAWRHEYRFTDWLGLDQLRSILGNERPIDRATILRHIGQLKMRKLLDWTTDGKNRYRFSILEVRLEQVAKSQFCDPSSSSGINPILSQVEPLLPPAKSQNCDLGISEAILDPEAWQAAREVGIGEPARTELANLPTVTAWYIRAMAAQAKRDGVEIGALIYRIRNDWPAPEWCEHCNGLDGDHAESCPTQAERQAREAEQALRIEAAHRETEPVEAISAEMQEAARLWAEALGELQLQLTGATFDTWLSRTRVVSRENGTFTIGVHNRPAKDWLENRLLHMTERTLTHVVGNPVEVRFIVAERGGGNETTQE